KKKNFSQKKESPLTLANQYFAQKWLPNGDIWSYFCAGFLLCSLNYYSFIIHYESSEFKPSNDI
ncbi:hypothetical protein CG823_09705, partial [Staphylococcus epidermidis]